MTLVLILVGRFLLGAHFAYAGIRNFAHVPLHTSLLEARHVPFARPVLIVGLLVQVLGGLSVALGILPAVGAAGLIVFVVAASVLYHDFWAHEGEARTTHLTAVLTNLALIGGFLLVIALS